jgi:hypothetical protein
VILITNAGPGPAPLRWSAAIAGRSERGPACARAAGEDSNCGRQAGAQSRQGVRRQRDCGRQGGRGLALRHAGRHRVHHTRRRHAHHARARTAGVARTAHDVTRAGFARSRPRRTCAADIGTGAPWTGRRPGHRGAGKAGIGAAIRSPRIAVPPASRLPARKLSCPGRSGPCHGGLVRGSAGGSHRGPRSAREKLSGRRVCSRGGVGKPLTCAVVQERDAAVPLGRARASDPGPAPI